MGKRLYKEKYGAVALSKLEKKVNQLAKVATPEVKFFDTAVTTTSALTLVKIPVSLVGQGDTDVLRDGDEIMIKNLYVKGSVTAAVAAGTVIDDHIRVILLQDFQQDADASVFVTLDFLQTDVWNSYYQASGNQKRFKVLSDKVYHIGAVGQSGGTETYQSTASSRAISYNIKLNRKMYFNGTATSQASQGRGKLYVCYISESTLHGIDIQARMTFQDS